MSEGVIDLGDAQTRAFLRRSRVALVATLSPKGRPFMTPLWFVVDGGELYITTGAGSWAARNVGRHPEVAMLFGGERDLPSDRFLRLRGQATCVAGLPPWRVLLRVAAKRRPRRSAGGAAARGAVATANGLLPRRPRRRGVHQGRAVERGAPVTAVARRRLWRRGACCQTAFRIPAREGGALGYPGARCGGRGGP